MKRVLTCLALSIVAICMHSVAFAAEAKGVDPDIIMKIATQFHDEGRRWTVTIQNYAIKLFQITLILEIVFLGIMGAIKRTPVWDIIADFCRILLFSGFLLASIRYFPEWSADVIRFFNEISQELGGAKPTDSPLLVGIELATNITEKISITSITSSLGIIIAVLIILVCFSLMTAQVLFITCESYVMLNAGIILLGLGGFRPLQQYAINFMRYAFSVAFKLFVLQLVLGIGISFIQRFPTAEEVTFEGLFLLIGASIVLLALVIQIPNTCAGIINGSHVSSSAAKRYNAHWDGMAAEVDRAALATFQLSGQQLADLQQDPEHFQNYLDHLLATPEGQMQAIQAGNQLAAIQVQESRQLRELIATQAQAALASQVKTERESQGDAEFWRGIHKRNKGVSSKNAHEFP